MSTPTPKQSRLTKLLSTLTWSRIILGAVLFLVFSIGFQAGSFLLENSQQLSPIVKITDNSHNLPLDLQLQVAYPTSVYDFSDAGIDQQPVSVWLWATQPVTNSTPSTYTINLLSPDNNFFFVDKDGLPAAAEAQIPPHSWPGEPVIIYIRQNSVFGEWKPAPLQIRVIDSTRPDQYLPDEYTVQINFLPWWLIWPNRILHILFGPTLTLASTAVALIGIAIQQETQRQEKLNEKDLEQKQKEVDNLKELLITDIGKGIRRWWQFTQWAKGLEKSQVDWLKPELENQLSDLWNNEIKELEWRPALLQEAVGFLNNGKYPDAKERAELIYKIDAADKSSETIAARLLAAYTGKTPQQTVNVAQEVGPEKVVTAIWWLYTSFNAGESKSIVKPVVVQILVELVGRAETIAAVHKILLGDKEGEHLLQEPQFGEVLNRFMTENHTSEYKKLAQELQAKRKAEYNWPDLWPLWVKTLPNYERTNILQWLQEAVSTDFGYNPFAFRKVELEPNFARYAIDSAAMDFKTGSQRQASPTLLFGDTGSGKTAAALLLANEYQKSRNGIFPVYYPLKMTSHLKSNASFYLDILLKAYGEVLTDFLVVNPHSFLDQSENQKAAMAYLLTYCAGSSQNLAVLLQQTQLSNDSAGRHLLKRMLEKSRDVPRHFTVTERIQLEMLREARPSGFQHTCILLDISLAPTESSKTTPAEHLQPLLELMLPLARNELYLKLFAPITLKQDLFIPDGVAVEVITWTPPELRSLLEARLQLARVTSLNEFFDQDANKREPAPTDRLITAAGNSPGPLIQLINRLIEYQAGKEPFEKINNETLEAVLETTPKERPLDE